MTRRGFILFGLVLLASALDLAVFSNWSYGGLSPQVFVVVAFFIFFRLPNNYLWWFIFWFYLFAELVYPPRYPGVLSLVSLTFFLLLSQAFQKFFKRSLLASWLFFFLINGFYFFVVQGGLPPARLLVQVFLNLLFYLALYPMLLAVTVLLRDGAEPQLRLRI